ncbi:unnamed protein product [Lactuca saligna]|uniref:Uncharacterized protein n=1 Tax=Lactuca saligna TaxID=75948 RepID=A0AA35ZKD5_LACSI|nr:unnamed protein product [Lactuca saligna]
MFSTISLSMGQASPTQVRDLDGKLVRSGTKYYIFPVIRGMGGGVTIASTRNESCPLDVVQANQEVDNGMPLTFRPVNPKKGVIRPICGNIGVVIAKNGSRRLAINEVPFKIMFKKA